MKRARMMSLNDSGLIEIYEGDEQGEEGEFD